MVSLPKNVSPAAARRRVLLLDAVLGVLIGIVVLILAAGVGVVGFLALLCALVLLASYLVELALRVAGRRRRPGAVRSTRWRS